MKHILFLLGLMLCIHSIKAQSCISSKYYNNDPVSYLSKIETPSGNNNLLIDRCLFSNNILLYNGFSNVKTSTSKKWRDLIKPILTISQKELINNIHSLDSISILYTSDFLKPIILTDIAFCKIKPESIVKKEFIERGKKLISVNSNDNSFSQHRFISASTTSNYIYGDVLKFIIPNDLVLTNQNNSIKSIFIDFGLGFEEVKIDEVFSVDLGTETKDVHVKIKIEQVNEKTNALESIYAHFTFIKKGSSLIPFPNLISETQLKAAPTTSTGLHYYPNTTKDIEYCFYFAPGNTSGKLRRPIIVCDGFDPGNTKNYYENKSETDNRGIYEILNGNPSKNEENPNRNSAELVSKLRARGFDIVIINFKSGDGDIKKNASHLQNFLNNVINKEYRDEYTEESVLVGPSMSGLITRYALATMEKNKQEHYVKQWISFDSPQKGANVSLGFQKLLYLLNDKWSSSMLENALKTLNSEAAQQMLLTHYRYVISDNNSKNPIHTSFYNELDKLGYPTTTHNYAISCGGNTKRFVDGAKIAEFSIAANSIMMEAYANHNYDGIHKIFHSRIFGFNRYIYTKNQIGYDNAPGSGYVMNGIFNNTDLNGFDAPNLPQYKSFTFMPVPTTFGIEVTRENVHKGWKYFKDNNLSPFDEIFGMNDNQDHVQLTKETADNIILANILDDEFTNTTIPVFRAGKQIVKTISKSVSFVAKERIDFAKETNKVNIKSTANVIAKAEKSITFYPGVSIEKGAILSAFIQNIEYSKAVLKNQKSVAIDYSKGLKYADVVTDYSVEVVNEIDLIENEISIFPNPTKDYININHPTSISTIKLITESGKTIYQKVNSGSEQSRINISMYPAGIYFIQIDNYSLQKVIKK